MKRRLILATTVITILLATDAFGQANLKVIAFYPKFCETTTGSAYYAIEPNDINWRGIDYVVHFWNTENVQSSTVPYFTLLTSANDSIDAEYNGVTNPSCGPSCWKPYQRQIIDSVHAVGGKVLMDIHQVNCEAFLAILPDSSKTEIFTYNVVQYLRRKGYDGVCINIEGWINNQGIPPASQLSRLTRRFRYWLNQMPSRGVLSYAPSMYDYDAYVASLDTAVDFYVVQGNYAQAWDGTLGSNANWFYQPLRKPNLCPNAGTSSWAGFLPNWINFGHPASKLAPIITTGGMVNIGSNQLCGKISNQVSDGAYAVYDWLVSHGGTLNWNDVAKQHYITGTATASAYFGSNVTINSGNQFFACPEDSASIYAKVVWMDSLGYFGASCYSFGTDADFTKPRGKKNVVIAKTVEIVAATNSPPIPPSAPTLSSPSNGATNAATSPTLSWNAASGADSYQLQVSTTSGFSTTVVNQSGITGTSFAVSGLTYSTTYYWRINATNGGGTSAYSTTWSFTTAAPPPPPSTPTLSSPSDGATGVSRNPTLNWNAASGAASYQLQVSTSSSFTTTVVNQSGITATSYAVSGLANSTTYYWQVNATNGGGTSAYSTSWSFATAAPPPLPSTPTLSSPSDGATAVSLSPTLNWNAVSGAASYQLQVSTSSGFSTTVVNQSGITTTSYVASGLSGTATYYWRVNATNDGGTSAYSTAWSFTTAAAPSGLVAAYSFDEGSGTTLNDVSGNGNNGAISGATWTASGKYGKALSFDGSSSYVDLGNPTALQITGSMTLEAWIYATANPADDGQIVSKSNDASGWQFKTSPDVTPHTFGGRITSAPNTSAQRYSSSTRSLNVWYHVASVYDSAARTLSIYVNDTLYNGNLAGTVPPRQNDAGVNAYIGRRVGGFYFNGTIDDVRIYNRALSQAEIQTDMNTPIGGTLSAPPTPTLNSPLNSAVGISTAPTLTWNASSGATSYQVQVSTSSSFTTTVVNQSGITSTSYAVSGLINNTVYYWRVNATNASGTSAYSSNWSFTTIVGAPSAPTLLSPSNAATGVSIPPTLNWNASTGATSYQLQVSTSSSFTTTVVNQSGITATSYAVSGLNNNTVYYWRVNATNAGGTSAYSSNWSFTTSISHGIVLPQGWSLISSVAMPPDLTLSTVLAKIIPHIELMKDAAGQVFWPALSINTIGTWDYHEGYQVHMLSADTLTITGSEIRPEATPVPLVQGVNLVPYLRHSPMQVDSALASVLNNLVIAKDNAGNVYWPSFGINSIGAMKPSQGYQVQVSQACTLVYPANASPGPPTILAKQGGPVNSSEIPSPLHYRLQTSNTGANAVLLVEGCKLKDGDEIAAWTTRKALVGSGVMSQGRALLTIWGDNTATEDVTEGATEGEPLSLTFWSAAEQKEGSLTVSSLLDAVTSAKAANSLCYKTDAVWVAQATQVVELPKAFSLSQNYPNPFNPSTVIRYALPKDAMVTLEIFNILGQRVALAVNEEQKAGNHEVIFQNSTLGSGIYFCRLTAGEFTATKKMVLIR